MKTNNAQKLAPKEDTWAFQPIGAPFPEAPVRVPNQQNMYVALWYKHGKPMHGRAWNNSGVVECSFAFRNAELKTKQQLEGQIQVLTYKGDYNSLGYWYEWLPMKRRFDEENTGLRELVRCGQSTPILATMADGSNKLGYLDLNTEVAMIANEGKVESFEGGKTQNFLGIYRNFKPPPFQKMYDDLWIDIRYGDPFPKNALPADGRKLKTETGEMFQYVALWYKHGQPVFGRAYPNHVNKTNAHFGKNNQETQGPEVGSLQLLGVPPLESIGLDYKWQTLAEGKKDNWTLVRIGNAAPCILKEPNGLEVLGNIDLSVEKASAGYGGKEKVISDGKAVAQLKVLFKRQIN